MSPSAPIAHLPKYAANPLIAGLPPEEISDAALKELLSVHVEVPTDEIRKLPARNRMFLCEDLYRLQIPLNRDYEFEFQMTAAIREGYMDRMPGPRYWEHHNREVQAVLENAGNDDLTLTNSRCLALTGISGSGKSRVAQANMRLYPRVITHDTTKNPFLPLKQVPCVYVDCPSNRSLRALCKKFFRAMGEAVGEPYEQQFGRGNVDEMLSDMARLAREHFLGLLVIDEIQHALGPKGTAGPALMRFIITLSNELRMPVLFIGTTKALTELRQRLATSRRLIGLTFDRFHESEPDWRYFLSELWKYQYTRTQTELTDELRRTIYDLTQGIHAFVVALFVLAQRREISRGACGQGDERLDSESFDSVYRDYFKAVDPVIQALRSGDDLLIEQFEDLPSQFKLCDVLAHQTKSFLSRELKRIDRATASAGKAIRHQIPSIMAHAAAGLENGANQKTTDAAQGLAAEAKKVAKAGGDPIKILEEKGLIKGS
jgi:energy-coupling factor transporter ATP-binding protein EcfA2